MAGERILVVDDELAISELVSEALKRQGFRVETASDGDSALEKAETTLPDLILLDLMLPKLSGTEVCREIRQRSNVPIIMLTAKDSEIDRVVGLEMGADDYITKPYSTRELLARMKAVLRRQGTLQDPEPLTVSAGPVELDLDRHVASVRGAPVRLPLKEFALLELLVRHAGRVLTRAQIMDRVWGPGYAGDTKTLEVHVKRLRAKVEVVPSEPRHILTVRGLGYRFEV